MNVGFLHITDLHISDNSGLNELMLQRMVRVIESENSFEYLIIIISGDIAFSGEKDQYTIADKLIEFIVYRCLEIDGIKDVDVFIVPGNHDVEGFDSLTQNDVEEAKKTFSFDSLIEKEKYRLKNFIYFAKGFSTFDTNEKFVYTKEEYKTDNLLIDIHLINSSIFSMKNEDKGYHYFSNKELAKLEMNMDSDANLKILVIHHPLEWYMDESKIELEKIIYNNIDIIFWGHEHNPNNIKKEVNGSKISVISQGGKLSNRGDWKDSEFKFLIFNVEENSIEMKEYKHIDSTYEKIKTPKIINLNGLKNESLSTNFYEDNKLHKKYDIRKLFVFPDLNRDVNDMYKPQFTDRIESVDKFIEVINENKYMLISGNTNSGKTYFLKSLFNHYFLKENDYSLYATLEDFPNSNNVKKKIDDVVNNFYGDRLNFDTIKKAMSENNKDFILFLDDIDMLDARKLKPIIDELKKHFSKIIFTRTSSISFDLEESERFNTIFKDTIKYEIDSFYGEKRRQLIKNVLLNEDVYSDEVDKSVFSIETSLRKQRSSLSNTPDFIVMYSTYVHKETGHNVKQVEQDGSIFSAVFEANVTMMFKEYVDAHQIDIYKTILGLIAMEIHKNKMNEGISQTELFTVIENYKNRIGISVDPRSFRIDILKAEIMNENDKGCFYFRNLDLHSYFLASELVRRNGENDTTISKDINYLLEYSCFKVNSNTLLFFTYMIKSKSIIDSIILKTHNLISDWIEYDFQSANIRYMSFGNEEIKLNIPTDKDKIEQKKKEDELDRSSSERLKKNSTALQLYQYDETEVDEIYNQLYRAISLLSIISKILPNFNYMLDVKTKEKIVEIIYKLPNKIFFKWAKIIDEDYENFISEFQEFLNSEKNIQQQAYDKDEARKITQKKVQDLSIITYLSLLDIAASEATSNSTYNFLKGLPNDDSLNYKIQFLMILSQTEKYEKFEKLANELNNIKTNYNYKNLVLRIIHMTLVRSDNIGTDVFTRIADTFFGTQSKKTLLLAQNRSRRAR